MFTVRDLQEKIWRELGPVGEGRYILLNDSVVILLPHEYGGGYDTVNIQSVRVRNHQLEILTK